MPISNRQRPRRTQRRAALLPPAALIALTLTGCVTLPMPTVDQKKISMVYILPGIEGHSIANQNIAKGLRMGGVEGAVSIFDWTTWGGPLGWYIHLTDTRRNRDQAARLARRIMKHIEVYGDRAVSVVAHSGGAGIALLAVEMLPATYKVDSVILLAAAVSPERDLTRALSHTRRGIWNFYSPRDIGFLVVGTSLFGTIDRRFGPGAGAVGFKIPQDLSAPAAQLYATGLKQVPFTKSMVADGNTGHHNGWTRRRFVAKWLAPIVKNAQGPVSAGAELATRTPSD